MENTFRNKATRDFYEGINAKAMRKLVPVQLHEYAAEQLDRVLNTKDLLDLRTPPSNHFEALHNDRVGQFSIRINNKYRVCFKWNDAEGAAYDVEIVNHYA